MPCSIENRPPSKTENSRTIESPVSSFPGPSEDRGTVPSHRLSALYPPSAYVRGIGYHAPESGQSKRNGFQRRWHSRKFKILLRVNNTLMSTEKLGLIAESRAKSTRPFRRRTSFRNIKLPGDVESPAFMHHSMSAGSLNCDCIRSSTPSNS